ncbi:MAG: hypothetical protein QNJ41_09320 [Xenococcaceae cyanobacterium MO_188.B32]|nr:hypothetical protein [Xenococcaceae cyanobacterium MO_188.B32]
MWRGFPKSAIYFPQYELLFEFETPKWSISLRTISKFKALLVSNFDKFHRYFHSQLNIKKIAVIIGAENFAHNILNELSGINRLYQRNLLNKVDKFLVLREPLGSIDKIFPEIPIGKIKYINQNKIWQEIVSNNYLVVNIGDCFIKQDLVNRVYQVAINNCSLEVINRIKKAKESYSPLLWVSIRVGNRTLTNQIECLSKVINALYQNFPQLGVVFDGFSLPADYGIKRPQQAYQKILGDREMEDIESIIKQQNEVANNIVNNLLSNIKVFNTIGCSIFETNIWANAIDIYLAHHGTMQHKVGWLANKPGVVHSNSKVLGSFKWIVGVREFEIRPVYINQKYARNVDIEKNGKYNKLTVLKKSFNYYIDWKVIYRELYKIAMSITNY